MGAIVQSQVADRIPAIFERRRPALAEELAPLFDRPSKVSQALDVLSMIATSEVSLSRRDIYERLGMATATLSGLMRALENDGYLVSSRRFLVSLGPRFLDDPVLSRAFCDTILALSAYYLETLAHRFDGTASLAFNTVDGCIVAATSGPLPRHEIQRTSACVLSQAIRGASPRDARPALTLRGISAGYADEATIVVASRLHPSRSSAAAIGLTTRTLTLAEFSDVSQQVATTAALLTSALRRVFPRPRLDTRSEAARAEW